GSTIDCAKVIAGAVSYAGDAWDIVLDPGKVVSVLPIVTVLTLSATGSEMDTFAVISNMETNDKIGTGHNDMRPKASILD
ncbi:iron-containing alcohol dehydrogenase, partial [Eggerthella lenta]|nr:iron-containing alcohol dehydrogenase [Eggerthella lenta]